MRGLPTGTGWGQDGDSTWGKKDTHQVSWTDSQPFGHDKTPPTASEAASAADIRGFPGLMVQDGLGYNRDHQFIALRLRRSPSHFPIACDMSSFTRILGIDPGLNHTGFGVIDAAGDKLTLVTAGCIHVEKGMLSKRLGIIHRELARIIEETQPAMASAEIVFVNVNPRSTLLLGQARGAALACAAVYGLEVAEYTPSEIKNAVVGTGRATKEQVQMMVQKLLGIRGDLQADAADALACAVTCAHAVHLSQMTGESAAAALQRLKPARRRTGRSAWEQLAAGRGALAQSD